MKNCNFGSDAKRGSAMFVVLGVVATVSVVLSIMASLSLNRTHMARKLSDRIRAQAYAEAGVAEAYALIESSWHSRTNASNFPDTNFELGSYDVSVSNVDQVAILTSIGVCRETDATVVLDVMNYGGGAASSGPPPGSAWEMAIFAGRSLDLKGNGWIDGGFHANRDLNVDGNVEFSGQPFFLSSSKDIDVWGDVKVDGLLHAPDVMIDGNNEGGATVIEETVPTREFPVIDLTPYYQIAVDNGKVVGSGGSTKTYSGDKTWKNQAGGVRYFLGNLRIKGNLTHDCILIANGWIKVEGNVNWDVAAGKAGSLLSRDRYIKLYGNFESDALVYCPQDLLVTGNVRLHGQVLCGEDVDLPGNIEAVGYEYQEDFLTEDSSSDEIIVGVSAWQR